MITGKGNMRRQCKSPVVSSTEATDMLGIGHYRYMSLEQNDSKDRTLFVLNKKTLLFCLTVHKTKDNEHRMYVQYLNPISFVFFYDNHNHSVLLSFCSNDMYL